MKLIKYSIHIVALLLLASCEQEIIELQQPETPVDTSCEDASAGDADFTKFVAIGSSYTAGFQAGALFNEGQNNSLGKILSTRFACVGGGDFNQPDIKSENGFNIFITPNPIMVGESLVTLGRFKLQGTPPQPSPILSGNEAIPNPQLNPGFMYTGSSGAVPVDQLNNFGVQAVLLAQAVALVETGDWNKADIDPITPGPQPHPYFNPFYARFASDPGNSTLFGDAISSLTNGGTFFLFWLGMDDFLLHAVYGGDASKAPLTSLEFESMANPGFKYFYNSAIDGLLANPTLKGVIANYPDIFVMPHFTSIPYNPVPLAEEQVTAANTGYGGYNQIIEALKGPPFNYAAAEVDARKISFAVGNNPFVIIDETLNDYGDEFDMLQVQGIITSEQREALIPYEQVRQTKSTDIIPLGAGSVLGTLADPGNESSVMGVAVPLGDQYALIPSEIAAIEAARTGYNAAIGVVAGNYPTRLALADVNAAFSNFLTNKAAIANNITITPNINPPTGIYSEEGLHPNSRGYAFIANIFIEAINAKFDASVPKVNLAQYSATALPINP